MFAALFSKVFFRYAFFTVFKNFEKVSKTITFVIVGKIRSLKSFELNWLMFRYI